MSKRAKTKPMANFFMFGAGLAALGLGLYLLRGEKKGGRIEGVDFKPVVKKLKTPSPVKSPLPKLVEEIAQGYEDEKSNAPGSSVTLKQLEKAAQKLINLEKISESDEEDLDKSIGELLEAKAVYNEYKEKKAEWDGVTVAGVSMNETDSPVQDQFSLDLSKTRNLPDWRDLKRKLRNNNKITFLRLQNVPEKLNDDQYDFIFWFLLDLVVNPRKTTPEAFMIVYPEQFDDHDDIYTIVEAVEMKQTDWHGLSEEPQEVMPLDPAETRLHADTQALYQDFRAKYAPSEELAALYFVA